MVEETGPALNVWMCPGCEILNEIGETYNNNGDCINKYNNSGYCHVNTFDFGIDPFENA